MGDDNANAKWVCQMAAAALRTGLDQGTENEEHEEEEEAGGWRPV